MPASNHAVHDPLACDLRSTLAPIEGARGLPNAFYVGEDALALEYERVFAPDWVCIGFGKDVPEPGDVRPVDLLGVPLFYARGRDNAVRVFHNVCSHRGMVLIAAPTRRRSVIRCPYHSWCYNLDGSLKATPHVGGPGHNAHLAIDRERLGLKEVRAAEWFDLIFVNLSGTAAAFDDFIRPLADRWRDFDPCALCHGGPALSIRLDISTNWKLAVENYCESYHLPWVHPGLNSYSRLEDHYTIVEPGRFSGQGTQVYRPLLSEDGMRFPKFPALPERWTHAAEYIALYPNVLLGIHKDHFFAIRLEPASAGRTIEHIEIYFASERALGDEFAAARQALGANWREVFEEDVGVVEGMQHGRASPAFTGGVFSPAMEQATHAFHRWVAEHLAAPVG